MDLWEPERACWAEGAALVCGVDEAGAGPLGRRGLCRGGDPAAGMEAGGTQRLQAGKPKAPERLFDRIREQASAWAVAWADEREIDETDILSARILAMQRAIDGLAPAADFALIDGNRDRGRAAAITTPHRAIVKGDSLSASIAAASILAKVSRDRYMEEMARRYPEYEFERHKGYPTRRHYELLRKYGPCPIHRRTFLKKL